MKKQLKILFLALVFIGLAVMLFFFSSKSTIPVLFPKGMIAREELKLILLAVGLMCIVVVPVLATMALFAWRYRAGNHAVHNTSHAKHQRRFELMWWAIPTVIIFIIALFVWKNTHILDPYNPINSNIKPLAIQVVAMRWKWLFIYPEQRIATVNFVQFPQKTPIEFQLTADGPMSSFWIPALSGQIYAMTGMKTKLNLVADETGDFSGSNTEINGQGFSGMKFVARASSQSDFDEWVKSVSQSSNALDYKEYKKLSVPSENSPVLFYSPVEANLYNEIIKKFMAPPAQDRNTKSMEK